MKPVFLEQTNREAELETLRAEAAILNSRLPTADLEGARLIRQQVKQIQRDIRRNTAILEENKRL